jgi:hypothetical protein
MAESSTITREMIKNGVACLPYVELLLRSESCFWKQITSCFQHLADLPRRVLDNVRARDVFGVLGHEALCRFCKPAFNLVHQGKPALPLAAQVGLRKHQVRCARKQKGNSVRLLCCRRRSISALIVAAHLFPIRTHSTYRYVAGAVARTTVQTAYLCCNSAALTEYAQNFITDAQRLALRPMLPCDPAALATRGAR